MKYFFVLLIACFSLVSINAQSFGILPVQTTGFKTERNQQFYTAFVKELLKHNYKVVDYANIDSVLKAYEYNLSSIVYNEEESSKLGGILKVKYLLFSSFIWNGEYTMIDIHVTDVDTSSIIYQNTFISGADTENIIKNGISIIVNSIFGQTVNTQDIFYDEKHYQETDEVRNIKQWARERKITNIYLAYGVLSGMDIKIFERDRNDQLYNSVLKKILDEKDLIESTGELVKVIHLGSYSYFLNSHIYDQGSSDIDYPYIKEILDNPSNGVLFFGSRKETAIIESFLSREKRIRYWNRWVW